MIQDLGGRCEPGAQSGSLFKAEVFWFVRRREPLAGDDLGESSVFMLDVVSYFNIP